MEVITGFMLKEEVYCLKISGKFSQSEINWFNAAKDNIAECQKLLVNVKDATDIDSTGFGMLLELIEHCKKKEIELVFTKPSKDIFAFMQSCKLDEVFNFEEEKEGKDDG